MYFFLFLVFLALIAAAIVIRRKVNEPGNAFGLWFERTMRPRMARAAKGADSVARTSRCPTSLRHTLLAENLGKPSLWVIITDPWY